MELDIVLSLKRSGNAIDTRVMPIQDALFALRLAFFNNYTKKYGTLLILRKNSGARRFAKQEHDG